VTGKFQTETISANAEVAAALNIAGGTPIVLRRTHRYLDKDPWALVVCYYPRDLVNGIPLEQAGASPKSAGLGLRPC